MTRTSLTPAFFLNSLLECVSILRTEKNKAGFLPQHHPALIHISGEVKILDHERDVAIPGLVEAQHTDPGV